MFSQHFPVLMSAGIVSPAQVDLVMDRLYFAEAAAANEVMSLDMTLSVATSFTPSEMDSAGVPVNAFGVVVKPVVNTYTDAKLQQSVGVFGVAERAVAQGSYGKLRIIGVCSPTVVASSGTLGSAWFATLDGTGKISEPLAPPGLTFTTGNVVKIVALGLANGGTSVFFNGFGFGYAFQEDLL